MNSALQDEWRERGPAWFDRLTDWMSTWGDPLFFPVADGASGDDAAKLLRADVENAARIIDQPHAKSEFLRNMIAYLVENEALSADQGEHISQRLEPLLAKEPIVIHVFDPNRSHHNKERHHRVKRVSQHEVDRATVEHIRENCAFEEEILDANGRTEGEVLLFRAQRADNPFRSIYDGRSEYGPAPEERGVADGLNFLFGVLTFGIGPGISGQLAKSYRNELYHQRGDEICKTRLQHLALAELGTSLNVDNLGGGVFSRGKVSFAPTVELGEARAFHADAPFVARDPETGIMHGLRRRIFRSGGRPRLRHHNHADLRFNRRGNEYYLHDPHKPNNPDQRVIVDESSGQWQYADELPPEAHQPGTSILHRDRKAFVTVQGQERELQWNFRENRYEIVVDNGVAREKAYWPVYMEPLSKQWQLAARNGRSPYTPENQVTIDQWEVKIAPENNYRQIDNLNSAYYGNGPLFEVREPGHSYTSQAQYQVVEMNGKLIPARANVIPSRGVSYEAYHLNMPDEPGRSIEWNGWQWVFEDPTSRQVSKKVQDVFARVPPAEVNIRDLSAPDGLGIRWSAEGRGYIKFNGRYMEIVKLGDGATRFYVRREDESKIILRYRDGKFGIETKAEFLANIRDVGLGGRSSRIKVVGRDAVQVKNLLRTVDLSAYEVPNEPQWQNARAALRAGRGFRQDGSVEEQRWYDQFYSYCRRLQVDAEEFFRRLPQITPEKMQSLGLNLDDRQVFDKLFSMRNGLIVGDNHYEIAAKELLIDNMAELKRQGVDTLYVEGLMADVHELDRYFSHPDEEMSQELRDELDGAAVRVRIDPDAPYTFRKVVEAARANGIQVKGLDCAATVYVPVINPGGVEQSVRSGERAKTFNYFASARIAEDRAQRSEGKWIAFVGTTHANTNMGVPGLAELTDSIGVAVTTRRPTDPPKAHLGIRPGRRIRHRDPAADLNSPSTDYVWVRT